MTPNSGDCALALAVALAAAQAVLPLLGAHQGDRRLMASAPALTVGRSSRLPCPMLASCVARSRTISRCSISPRTASVLKPFIYRITGTWGNHEGSILLWCLILVLVRRCGRGVRARLAVGFASRGSLEVLGLTSAGFLLFALILLQSVPARSEPPPIDGRDMNPLLQDPGLAIHPPVLYAGYVGFAIPFAFARSRR